MKKSSISASRALRTLFYIFLDIIIIYATFAVAYLVAFNSINWRALIFSSVVVICKVTTYAIFGQYKSINPIIGLNNVVRVSLLIVFTDAIAAIANVVIPSSWGIRLPMLTYVLIVSLEILLSVGARAFKKVFVYYFSTDVEKSVNTIIIGAGSAGKIAFDELHNNPEFHNIVSCFLDDDINKKGTSYLGKPIFGTTDDIKEAVAKYNVKEVIIAIAKISKKDLKAIIDKVSKENVIIKRLPILTEMDISSQFKIKDVSLAELLGRDQITFDTKQISEWVKGKTVLVTGGGGSIGSELSRQLYSFGVKKLILFDIYENAVYDIQQELVRRIRYENSDCELITLIGSTYNEFRVEEIFAKYHPDIVFHAAAYKHVPLMEDSPVEAIRTNCLGTYNVAKMADKYKTQKMVLVSTDKAVRPTNTMGATKAFAEMIIRFWDEKSENTSYSAVRFGNVLGSNGSVIPLFKKQIAEGGPVTVTHPDIIRYFMTIPEAVSLILQSGTYATGGEIFILDMGKPVKILTLAENVIKQCGFVPYKDIDIVFTGLRPGEKLYEELLLDVTEHTKTSNDKIYVEEKKSIVPMDEKIQYISKVFTMTDNDEIKNCLREVVTNYTNYEEFNEKNKVAVEKL